jgi:Leucine-rich repeat (LRR) protein
MTALPLTHLDLSDFKFIGDEAILSLAEAKNLQMLSLSGTMLTDVGSAVLIHMSSLKELLLDRTDIGDKSMEYLRGQLSFTTFTFILTV